MHQVWHIFQKDVRHRWREILVLFALLIVYGWYEVRSWASPGLRAIGMGHIGGLLGEAPGLVRLLVPLLWIFLVLRIVQDESLVGDRQFWITRPYEWKKLLAAKFLFAFVFIGVPLVVLQVVLIALARFSPLQHLSGMLCVQLGVVLVVILPVLTLASVTATIAQFLLGVVILVLYFSGVAYISSLIPDSGIVDPSEALQLFLVISTILVVILLQYSRRFTAKSRLLLAALAMVIVLIVALAPYRSFVKREFPRLSAGQNPPVQFSLVAQSPGEKTRVPENIEEVAINIPLQATALASDSIVTLRGQLVTLEAPNGITWDSGWKSQYATIYSDNKKIAIGFQLKKELFEQLKAIPVKLKVSLVYNLYHDEDRRDFTTPAGEFLLPELGRCISDIHLSGTVHCRAVLPRRFNLLVATDLSTSTCPIREDQHRANSGLIGHNWQSRDMEGPYPALSPIADTELYISDWDYIDYRDYRILSGICPGTPLTLSHPRLVSKAQHSVELNNIRLVDYQAQGFLFGTSTGLSIDVQR